MLASDNLKRIVCTQFKPFKLPGVQQYVSGCGVIAVMAKAAAAPAAHCHPQTSALSRNNVAACRTRKIGRIDVGQPSIVKGRMISPGQGYPKWQLFLRASPTRKMLCQNAENK